MNSPVNSLSTRHTWHRISSGPRPDVCLICEVEVKAAVNRLLKIEKQILKMDRHSRDWFFSKEGHRDTFLVAKAMRNSLRESSKRG